ncbi:phosphate ABC transporter permease PstA [Aeoliella mucimassa]|uniref:Phosphate transport system permease protein PstA n=1 Tax=Aeoliella mucimassa TaxID=2527972 RepID=A0A518AJ63_9BACT|nr:phosphate ABC transporter permease PstA [Aeoliella mucimassa]QDU54746.1 Phosphate transport system permease protein PstA [Aeoliella mucimassa]
MMYTEKELANMASFRVRQRFVSSMFRVLCMGAMWCCLIILAFLLFSVLVRGLQHVDWSFLTGLISRDPEKAGIWVYLISSLWLILLTTLFSIPIGVGAALYLEEYAADTRWKRLVQLNIANLAGVPSIVYGLLGLGLFVWAAQLGRSILAGSLTLTLVILPIVILASQEALRAVPNSIRQASYALGATRWQTTWRQVLPAATPGIMTGVILSISRALGEAAPLVAMGAVQYMNYAPVSVNDSFTALPLAIFQWAGEAKREFHELSAAAIIVLLVVLISLNMIAAYVRHHFGKRVQW